MISLYLRSPIGVSPSRLGGGRFARSLVGEACYFSVGSLIILLVLLFSPCAGIWGVIFYLCGGWCSGCWFFVFCLLVFSVESNFSKLFLTILVV